MRARTRSTLAAALAGVGAAATVIRGDWIAVTLPDNVVCNVMDHGAVGNGVADDTGAIQAAINACSPSGVVQFPSGYVFSSFALVAKDVDGFGLQFMPGSTLRFNNDTSAPQWTKDQPDDCITITGQHVAIYGGGLVDGNGAAWWPNPNGYRPGLVNVNGAELLVTDATFINSPNHNLRLYADNTEVVGVTVYAWPPCDEGPTPPGLTCAHNTDAIDVHGNYMWIHRSNLSVGERGWSERKALRARYSCCELVLAAHNLSAE